MYLQRERVTFLCLPCFYSISCFNDSSHPYRLWCVLPFHLTTYCLNNHRLPRLHISSGWTFVLQFLTVKWQQCRREAAPRGHYGLFLCTYGVWIFYWDWPEKIWTSLKAAAGLICPLLSLSTLLFSAVTIINMLRFFFLRHSPSQSITVPMYEWNKCQFRHQLECQ